jgi:hypothetical protein
MMMMMMMPSTDETATTCISAFEMSMHDRNGRLKKGEIQVVEATAATAVVGNLNVTA